MCESAVSAVRVGKNVRTLCHYFIKLTVDFPCFHRPYVILAIGVGVLVVVFLFYFLITRGNPPKEVLFFGNQPNYVHFPTDLLMYFPIPRPHTEIIHCNALLLSWFRHPQKALQNFTFTMSEWKQKLFCMWFHVVCQKLLRLIRLRAKLRQTFLKHNCPWPSASKGLSQHLLL